MTYNVTIYDFTILLGIIMVAIGAAGLGSLCQNNKKRSNKK